jgi:hypothetical protein
MLQRLRQWQSVHLCMADKASEMALWSLEPLAKPQRVKFGIRATGGAKASRVDRALAQIVDLSRC